MVPAAPGDYTLTLDLVSESVTWFAAQGQRPVTAAVKVKPLDVDGRRTGKLVTDRADARRVDARVLGELLARSVKTRFHHLRVLHDRA